MARNTLPLHAILHQERENSSIETPEKTFAEQLRQERLTSSILRANAEQARRMADCTRASLETLLLHLDQPYAVVDRNGTVTQWNDSLAALSGITAQQAVGQELQSLLHLPPTHPLTRALCALTPAATYHSQPQTPCVLTAPLSLHPNVTAAQITLIPLCHVPGSLEAMIILARPV